MFNPKYPVLTLAILLFTFSSCQPEKPKAEKTVDKNKFVFKKEQQHFAKASDGCKSDSAECATIEMNFPQFKEKGAIFQQINDSILHYVKTALTFEDEEIEASMNLNDLGNRFIQDYNEYTAESKLQATEDNSDPFITGWSIETEGQVTFESPKAVSISLSNYTYTGGAHPNSNITLLNYSVLTGKPLKIKDLVSNQSKLVQLAEQKFRKTLELAANANLNDQGYFWDGKFQLPANFGIVEEGLLFFYNSYEIAAYAVGPTDFVLTWEELGDLLDMSKLK